MSAITLAHRPSEVPGGTAAADFLDVDLAGLRRLATQAGDREVEAALSRSRPSLADFAVLVSEAAAPRLEDLARRAAEVTLARFGRTVRLFAPLYLSNECVSVCTYCGFSATNQVARRTLSVDEVVSEARELVARGFRHLLLVSGEHPRLVSKEYVESAIAAIAPFVPSVSVEVQAWDTDTYRRFLRAGCEGLVVYQETYDRVSYEAVHRKGKKRNYSWRLAAPDRGGEAGMRRLGIGALFGLHPDWRTEAVALAAHARALLKRWWRSELTLSLPRLQPCAGSPEPATILDDAALAQVLCALRLLLPDAGIVLSTRERPALRDALLGLGVTHMSAGSHTEPGGYASPSSAEPQFAISDHRAPTEVAAMLRSAGFDPVWKDWQRA